MTAYELYSLVHRQRRTIKFFASLLILQLIVLGISGWSQTQKSQIIASLETLHKADELRITNLAGRVEELEKQVKVKELEQTTTSRGGNVMRYTIEEVKEIAKVVHAEATGEPPFGKMLVARVVLNRAESNPDMSVGQIINHPNAFAQAEVFDGDDLNAVWRALDEKRFRDVFTFFNPVTAPNQEFVASKMSDKVLEIGNHVFCR